MIYLLCNLLLNRLNQTLLNTIAKTRKAKSMHSTTFFLQHIRLKLKQLELKTKVLPTGYVTVVPTAVKADDNTSPTFRAITCGSLIPCTSAKQYIINYSFWCQYQEELLDNNT